MDFLPFVWSLIGILMIIAEFFIPGFVIFFFGAGALLNGLITAIFPFLRSRFLLQVVIWLTSSGLSLFTLRKYFSKIFKGKLIDSRNESEYAGKKALVIKDISPDSPGRVRFEGTSWRAISYDETLRAGEEVEILKKENLTLFITRSILGDSDNTAE